MFHSSSGLGVVCLGNIYLVCCCIRIANCPIFQNVMHQKVGRCSGNNERFIWATVIMGAILSVIAAVAHNNVVGKVRSYVLSAMGHNFKRGGGGRNSRECCHYSSHSQGDYVSLGRHLTHTGSTSNSCSSLCCWEILKLVVQISPPRHPPASLWAIRIPHRE